jgi:hypothetical protein
MGEASADLSLFRARHGCPPGFAGMRRYVVAALKAARHEAYFERATDFYPFEVEA